MENFLNIKCKKRHQTLEYRIKALDTSQNLSRSAIFERAVKAAQGVNWKDIQMSLLNLEIEEAAPVFTSYQVKISDETAKMLETIRADILEQLDTLKVLQSQYMLLLLQANYLEKLKRNKMSLKADIDEESIDLPEMSKILCEMMLTDKDSDKLLEIRRILVSWKNTVRR